MANQPGRCCVDPGTANACSPGPGLHWSSTTDWLLRRFLLQSFHMYSISEPLLLSLMTASIDLQHTQDVAVGAVRFGSTTRVLAERVPNFHRLFNKVVASMASRSVSDIELTH